MINSNIKCGFCSKLETINNILIIGNKTNICANCSKTMLNFIKDNENNSTLFLNNSCSFCGLTCNNEPVLSKDEVSICKTCIETANEIINKHNNMNKVISNIKGKIVKLDFVSNIGYIEDLSQKKYLFFISNCYEKSKLKLNISVIFDVRKNNNEQIVASNISIIEPTKNNSTENNNSITYKFVELAEVSLFPSEYINKFIFIKATISDIEKIDETSWKIKCFNHYLNDNSEKIEFINNIEIISSNKILVKILYESIKENKIFYLQGLFFKFENNKRYTFLLHCADETYPKARLKKIIVKKSNK